MTTFLQFVLIGLGPGAVYALAGCGAVLVYRGSGVLNFAQGAQALLAAEVFVRLWQDHRWPLGLAVVATVTMSAFLGVLIHAVVMRPLADSPQVVRVIATLGLLAVFQQAVIVIFGTDLRLVPNFLPTGTWSPMDGVAVGYDRLTLLVIAATLSLGLATYMRYSRFGILTTAVAENRLAADALGHSPHRVAMANWALGSALAGLAGVLIVPIAGLGVQAIVLLVVPAFAAALIGGFSSFVATFLGALAIGIGQSLLTKYVHTPGGGDAFVFVVIIAVMAIRGSVIPRRDEHHALLPRVGRRGVTPWAVLALPVAMLAVGALADRQADVVTTTMLFAIVALSLVVLTGLAGQLSLAQFAIAGFGGWVAARMSNLWRWPFPVVGALGVAAAVAVGLVFSLPALRTRGASLAVSTLGMALALESVVFGNPDLVGGFGGTRVQAPRLFGIDLHAATHPQRYAALVVLVFGLLGFLVANLRSSRIGRRLLSIRSNERAAASLGINVAGVKAYAFAVSALVAAVGGVLMAFRFDAVVYDQYKSSASLTLLTNTMIGGIGYIAGAVVGALMLPAGLVSLLTEQVDDLDRYLIMASGALLIATLIKYPNGVADSFRSTLTRVRARIKRSRARRPPSAAAVGRQPRPPGRLVVDGLTVRFGVVTAVDEFSLVVEPGRVTGLIGPNGAGKTTLIDAVSGFTRATKGRIELDGRSLVEMSAHRRGRLGLGRCFQSVELFDDLSVRENLLLASDDAPWPAWIVDLLWPRRQDLPQAIAEVATSLGIESVLDRFPPELSYGDRKLVGVARALSAGPSVLMLDEPAAGLGERDTADLGRLLRRIASDMGLGVLLVEHDVGLVAAASDEIVVMDFGRIIAAGPSGEVLRDARVVSAYLGDAVGEDQLAVTKGVTE